MSSPEEVFRQFVDSEEAIEHYRNHNQKRDEIADEELRPLIEDFKDDEVEISEFRSRVDGLNKRNQLWGFEGFVGGMHFNKLLGAAPDKSVFADRLREAIYPPDSLSDARETIDTFAAHTQRLKENDIDFDPFPKSTIFFLSYFWHIQEPTAWPVFYPKSEQYLDEQGLLDTGEPYGSRYEQFVKTLDQLREQATNWLDEPVDYRDVSNAIYWYQQRDDSEDDNESTTGNEETPTQTDVSYLPPAVADIDEVARGTETAHEQYESADTDLANIFEQKCRKIFTMLGFDTTMLGQGTGRNPDGIAVAVRNDYAVIYDAKKREDGYRIGRDDRTIREYIETHNRRLRDQGKQHIYFTIISSSFRDSEESTLRDLRTSTDVDNVVLLRAEVLQELLHMRLQEPYLNLNDIEWVFGNRPGEIQSEELENIIPEWRQEDEYSLLF